MKLQGESRSFAKPALSFDLGFFQNRQAVGRFCNLITSGNSVQDAFLLLFREEVQGLSFAALQESSSGVQEIGHITRIFKKQTGEITGAWIKTWAESVPDMLMQDSSWQNQIILQWLSDSPTAHYIDMEIEYMKDDYIGMKPQLKYLRYNFPITENDLNSLKISKKSFTIEDVGSLVEMSNAGNREILYRIGKAAGEREIKEEHFDA